MEDINFDCPYCNKQLEEKKEEESINGLSITVNTYYCNFCKREIEPEDYAETLSTKYIEKKKKAERVKKLIEKELNKES